MKKILCMSMVLAILWGICTALHVHANDMSGALTDAITWAYDPATQTLTINGTGAMPDYGDGNPAPYKIPAQNAERVVIAEGITRIGHHAFLGLEQLNEVIIPSSVSDIAYSFIWGEYPMLTDITVSADNPVFSSFEGNLYNKDQTALLRYAVGKTEECFEVPDGVTELGRGVFAWATKTESISLSEGISTIPYEALIQCTALTTLAIPNTLSKVENWAIENAPLTDVYYDGTKDDWNQIAILRSEHSGIADHLMTNTPLFNATIHCTDGDMMISGTTPTVSPTEAPVTGQSDHVVTVTTVSKTKFGDDDGYVIEGLKGGRTVSYNVCDFNENCEGYSLLTDNKLRKGDAIMVTEGENYLSMIQQKTDTAAFLFGAIHGHDGRFGWEDYTGLATERHLNDVTFADGTEKNLAGATFTLVSNNGGAYIIIKNSSIGAINTNNTNGYQYVLYVRSYDDDPVDVVIYEFYPNVETPMASITPQEPSDVNGDGKTNAKDVTILRRLIANGQGGIDLSGDGQMNAKDVTFLRRFIANNGH